MCMQCGTIIAPGEFPSPLGEMGLSICTQGGRNRPQVGVSVPSRGNGVIDIMLTGQVSTTLLTVSVPSRGNGVIDFAILKDRHNAKAAVSVPSRGNGVIDSIDNASST